MNSFIKALPPDIARSVAAGLVSLVVVNMVFRPVYDALDKRFPQMEEFREKVENVITKLID